MSGYFLKDQGDMTLMKSVVRGRMDALEELKERYQDLVSRTAFRILCDHADCEFVTGAVFETLWNRALDYDDRYTLSQWLLRLTVNASRRRMHHRRLMSLIGKRQKIYVQTAPHVEDADDYITTQAWEIYCRACVELTVGQRIIYSLLRLENMTEDEVVLVTGYMKMKVRMADETAGKKVKAELDRFGRVADYDAYLGFLRKVRDRDGIRI